jgi:MinD superfamily P-loop ATPase
VIASVTGVDYAVIVTEPTLSGKHDLERILQTTKHFHIPAAVILNKADLNPDLSSNIETYCNEQGLQILARIPFSQHLTDAMVNGKTIQEHLPQDNLNPLFQMIWKEIKNNLAITKQGEIQ